MNQNVSVSVYFRSNCESTPREILIFVLFWNLIKVHLNWKFTCNLPHWSPWWVFQRRWQEGGSPCAVTSGCLSGEVFPVPGGGWLYIGLTCLWGHVQRGFPVWWGHSCPEKPVWGNGVPSWWGLSWPGGGGAIKTVPCGETNKGKTLASGDNQHEHCQNYVTFLQGE